MSNWRADGRCLYSGDGYFARGCSSQEAHTIACIHNADITQSIENAVNDRNELWTRIACDIFHEMLNGKAFENPMLALTARVAIEDLKG